MVSQKIARNYEAFYDVSTNQYIYLVTEFQFPDILQEVETPVVNNFECDVANGGIITDNLICAGFLNEGGKGPCAVRHFIRHFLSKTNVFLYKLERPKCCLIIWVNLLNYQLRSLSICQPS